MSQRDRDRTECMQCYLLGHQLMLLFQVLNLCLGVPRDMSIQALTHALWKN